MFGARVYLFSALAVVLAVVHASPAPARFVPVLPSRNTTSGQTIQGNSSAPLNTTLGGGSTVTTFDNIPPTNQSGTNGSAAACGEGFGAWCEDRPKRRSDSFALY